MTGSSSNMECKMMGARGSAKPKLMFLFIGILCVFGMKTILQEVKIFFTPVGVSEEVRAKSDVFVPAVIPEYKDDIGDVFTPDGRLYNIQDGIVYHCITKTVYEKVTPPYKTRDFQGDKWAEPGEDPEARKNSFQGFFDLQKSIGGKQKTPELDKYSSEYRSSGPGSTMEAAKNPLQLLNTLIDRLKVVLNKPVISMVDIPCGDFYWMRHFVGNRSDVQYTGIDIVPTLIERHKRNFRNITHAQFKNLDIVTAGLQQSYDVIFCRDMLQHLTNADVLRVLEHFSRSGSKLLVTTNLLIDRNIDLNLKKTRYRHLNLMLPPVSLVPPLCSMRDSVSNHYKDLAVWKLPLKQNAEF